jgi:DNA-binding SARP family transcriptional activator
MEFRVLGPLEVLADGRALDFGGLKQRALLAALLMEANRIVSSDRLIEALWEDEPPETAKKALQVYVSQLRKLLGRERLQTKAPGYLLRVEEEELDLHRFEHLRRQGRNGEALSLFRGAPLADFAYQRFAQSEIARLEELRLACLEDRIDADLSSGRHAELIGELGTLVREHPLRQRLRGQMMLALYRSGRDAEALDVFQDARTALVEELGIEPRRELRELQQAILNQDPVLDLAAEQISAESPRGVFVGRGRELEELLTGLEDAFAGRGRLFLLVGEPGIGKSRLAEELIRVARARGVDVLVGRCWEASGAPAYWPWVQSLRGLAGEVPPELRGEAVASDDESARFRLFDATAQFLRASTRERPLVLLLDDLHAADTPSLLLLEFVVRELGSMRLLIVGACRDVDPIPGEPLASMLAAVAREPVMTRLSLRGLSPEAVADYVEAELASRELAPTLYESTEGNPLFLGETVRLLALEGRVAISPSIRDVIGRRLAHLGDECNRVLELASVLGREFALNVLAHMNEADDLELLDEAMTARVVTDVPGTTGRLRFAHALIRDTIYEGITSARRLRLHRLAVEALEQIDAEPAELAHHSLAGGDLGKGLDYATRAGDRALALLGYEEAARQYELGLQAMDMGASAAGRCDLLLALGHAQERAGDGLAAKATFLRAVEAARTRVRPEALARAALGYGGRFVWARAGDDLLPTLLREAIGANQDDPALRARLLARLATALRRDPDIEPSKALSAEAVAIARSLGDPATLAYTLVASYAARWEPGNPEERLAIATELLDVAERSGDKERAVEGQGFRFNALLELGQVEAAAAHLAARARLIREMRQPAQRAVQLWLETTMSLLRGEFEAADHAMHRALELGGRTQGDEARITFEIQRFVLRREQGRLAEIESALTELPIAYPARPVLRCVEANLQAELGRIEQARRRLIELVDDDFKRDGEWLFSVALLAETCRLVHERECAATLYDRLLPFAELNVAGAVEASLGATSRYLGILASVLTRLDDAARHFEHALAFNERMGARPWLVHTQDDYAGMRPTWQSS